jgi:hypothetical protein
VTRRECTKSLNILIREFPGGLVALEVPDERYDFARNFGMLYRLVERE